MKHIKLYNTHTQYESDGRVIPNVSYCKDTKDVHYNKDHEYVDLGLPSGTLWATTNVGATKETDTGNYYMYGKGSVQHHRGDSYYTGTENPLSSEYDTATQEWGKDWCMPTDDQFNELERNTTHLPNTIIDGVVGSKFVNKTDSSKYIFIPYSGYYHTLYEELQSLGSSASVWSSTPYKQQYAWLCRFTNEEIIREYDSRGFGCVVRPVRK